MNVRIYRPAKTATQSGLAGTQKWVIEFEPAVPRVRDPLTGWTGSSDMRTQLRLNFDTLEEAITYADKHGLAYSVQTPQRPRRRVKSYADNFRYARPGAGADKGSTP